MATHSSILAWRTPWTEEPGGLQSRGSQRDGQDSATQQQRTMGWFLPLIKKQVLQYVAIWRNFEEFILSEVNWSQKDKYWVVLLMRGI